jgi:hypothetical protein
MPLKTNPGFIIITQKSKGNPWYIAIQVLMCKEIQNCTISKKVMLTTFWDARGVLYMELLIKRSMVNSDRYCATLRSLKKCIHRIRPERNTLLLHHENARPHCSAQTQTPWEAWNSQRFHTLLTAHFWHCQTSGCSQNWRRH